MADRSSDGPNLPQDVAVEVLKRLPVESLLRCRCVCRSWRSTIDDPRFVAIHSNHSALHGSNWRLVCLRLRHPVQSLCSLFSNESLTLPSKSQIEIPFVTPPHCYGIVGSCNGLICVAEISGNGFVNTMYLWNLSTRKHRAVLPSSPGHELLSHIGIVSGFGFDARSNDYKIVRILRFPVDHYRCFGGTKPKVKVEIYSLGTDCWRSLECEVPALWGVEPAVFLNGNLHWLAFGSDDEGMHASIVLFDVAGEVFDEMAMPEETFHEDNGCLIVSLAVVNDLLAVFTRRGEAAGHPERHSVCFVWVMSDYGMPESWTKLYTFEYSGLVKGFDGVLWNGGLLLEIDGGQQVSLNPITGQITNLPLLTTCDLVTVVESLISL